MFPVGSSRLSRPKKKGEHGRIQIRLEDGSISRPAKRGTFPKRGKGERGERVDEAPDSMQF